MPLALILPRGDQYVCMYGHHILYRVWINRVSKVVANPARGQLNRQNEYSPVPVRAWEFGQYITHTGATQKGALAKEGLVCRQLWVTRSASPAPGLNNFLVRMVASILSHPVGRGRLRRRGCSCLTTCTRLLVSQSISTTVYPYNTLTWHVQYKYQ